jgi:hypothetical protein
MIDGNHSNAAARLQMSRDSLMMTLDEYGPRARMGMLKPK